MTKIMMLNNNDFITPTEVAKMLGYNRTYVYLLLKQGVIPGKRLHGNRSKWMIKRSDIEAMCNDSK